MISEEIDMTKANSAFVCCNMIVRSLYLFQEKMKCFQYNFQCTFYIKYGAVGDPLTLKAILDCIES